MNARSVLHALALSLCAAGPVHALERFHFNGFATLGLGLTDSEVPYYTGHLGDDPGIKQDSRVGLQISANVTDRLLVTTQLLARAREDDYALFFDWGFVSYAFDPRVTLRGGKLKFPTFLISDYFEVGYAYPWIRPPQEVYSSNPLTAITGVDLLWRIPLGQVDLLVQPYLGSSRGQETQVPQFALETDNAAGDPFGLPDPGSIAFMGFQASHLIGINSSLTWAAGSLRAGYLTTDVTAGDVGVIDADQAQFWSVGGTLDWRDVVAYAEYFERDIDGLANLGFPNQRGYYLTLGHRIGKFLPHITYARLEDNDNPRGPCGRLMGNPVPCGEALEQASWTLGLRYELTSGAALKIEAQRMSTDRGRGLFTGYVATPTGSLRSDPGAVDLYSVAVELVF